MRFIIEQVKRKFFKMVNLELFKLILYRYRLLFFIFIVLSPSKAISEDYWWEFQGTYAWESETAAGSCEQFFEWYRNYYEDGVVGADGYTDVMSNYRVEWLTNYEGQIAHCKYDLDRGWEFFPDQSGQVNRRGDSCPEGYQDDGLPPSVHGNCVLICDQFVIDGSCHTPTDLGEPEGPQSCPAGASGPQPQAGNPINFTNGNKFQYEVDVSLANNFDALTLSRSYNSKDSTVGAFGRGWSSAFLSSMNEFNLYDVPNADSSTTPTFTVRELTTRKGKRYEMRHIGGNWESHSNVVASLFENSNTWTFETADREIYVFGNDGKIQSITNAQGLTQTYGYNGSGQVDSISDDFGNTISLTYNNGFVDTATVPGYGTFTYGYTGDLLTTVSFLSVETGATPVVKTYVYDDPNFAHLLTGIIDEEGKRYATWSYDAAGRAITSEHGDNGAEKVTIHYDSDTQTRVVNAAGKEKLYTFQKLNGVPQITHFVDQQSANCPLTEQSFTYDSNGFLETRLDAEGNVTRYIRNDRGQVTFKQKGLQWSDNNSDGVVSVDELFEGSSSQKIDSTWHNTFNLRTYRKVSGIDANGLWQDYTSTDTVPDTYGRAASTTVTDLTNHSVPYATYGRTRTTTYSYTYYPGTAKPQTLTVNGPGLTSEIVDNVDDITIFHYNTQGLLTSRVNALGHTVTYDNFTALGQPQTITDENNVVTTINYDALGYLDTVTVATSNGNAQTDYDYLANGLLHKITLADDSSLTFTYNDARQLTDIHNHLDEHIEFDPNVLNGEWKTRKVYKADDTLWQQAERVYDELGRVMTLLGNDGQHTDIRYDNNGQVEDIDELGHATLGTLETRHVYDALGRLDTSTNAEQALTDFSYDGQNQLVGVTDARNNTTEYIVDGFGQTIREVSPDRGTTTYWYDTAGNLTQTEDAEARTTTYTYDALGRVKVQSGEDGGSKTWVYDMTTGSHDNSVGRVSQILEISSQGNIENGYSYNELGQVSSHTQAITPTGQNQVSFSTQYYYDLAGKPTLTLYPGYRMASYVYHSDARLQKLRTAPKPWLSSSDLLTNLTHAPFGVIDGYTYANGLSLSKSFDLDGRIDNINLSDGSSNVINLSYDHDAFNNINKITDSVSPTKTQDFVYDEVHRLDEAEGLYGIIDYDYDLVGNRTSKTRDHLDGNISSQNVTFNGGNNKYWLRSDGLNGSYGTTFPSFDDSGNMIILQDNGIVSEYYYNEFNRLKAVDKNFVPQAEYLYNALGQKVYGYYPQSGVREYYIYDTSGQLISIADGSGMPYREYLYLNGEKVAMIFHKNGAQPPKGGFDLSTHNAYSGQDTSSYGNVTVSADGKSMTLEGNRWRYTSDTHTITANTYLSFDFAADGNAEFQGIGLDESPSSLNSNRIFNLIGTQNYGIQNYSYTGGGATQSMSIPVGQHFTGSGFYLVLLNDNDANKNDGVTTISNVRLCEGPCPDVGSDLEETGQAQTYFVHNDHLGTPKMMTDENQSVVWAADYTPYGELVSGNPYTETSRFPGQYFDVATGTHYNYFRDYDPTLGRYIQSDPIGLAGGINTYAYVGSNPVNRVDPFGLDAIPIVFPDYKPTIPRDVPFFGGSKPYPFGHAGIIIYNKNGNSRYYEFGRYVSLEGECGCGAIRNYPINDFTLEDGFPTAASLNAALAEISKNSGDGTRILGAHVPEAQFSQMNDFGQSRLKENSNPNREKYDFLSNNCAHFMMQMLEVGNTQNMPWFVTNPSPVNMISEILDEGYTPINWGN